MGEAQRVQIAENQLRAVVYLLVDRFSDHGELVREPIGTGFFTAIPLGNGRATPYVVTARHVIERAERDEIFVRWNTADGPEDSGTTKSDWFVSEEDDVALIQARRPSPNLPNINVSAVNPRTFITAAYRYEGPPMTEEFVKQGQTPEVGAGDEIFFVGLFQQVAGQGKNLPIVRTGTIARMPSEPLILERFPDPQRETFKSYAYLAELRSWGGHSGSPAFWTHPYSVIQPVAQLPGVALTVEHFMCGLLGLISAHYDIATPARVSGDILGDIRTPVNSGIAVITPAEAIRRLLMREDVENDRRTSTPTAEETPTMDSIEDSEFERFEDLARKLVHTPKPKDDEAKRGES